MNCSLRRVWVLNSGYAQHVTWNKDDLINYKKLTPGKTTIEKIGEVRIPVVKTGNLVKRCTASDSFIKITFKKVLHAPKIRVNLISVTQLLDKGAQITLTKNNCQI
jgi:hypothetical protein